MAGYMAFFDCRLGLRTYGLLWLLMVHCSTLKKKNMAGLWAAQCALTCENRETPQEPFAVLAIQHMNAAFPVEKHVVRGLEMQMGLLQGRLSP